MDNSCQEADREKAIESEVEKRVQEMMGDAETLLCWLEDHQTGLWEIQAIHPILRVMKSAEFWLTTCAMQQTSAAWVLAQIENYLRENRELRAEVTRCVDAPEEL